MKNPKSNLSKGEQKSIEELAKRKDIVITNAGKGGAVVIMNTSKKLTASYQINRTARLTRRPNTSTQ